MKSICTVFDSSSEVSELLVKKAKGSYHLPFKEDLAGINLLNQVDIGEVSVESNHSLILAQIDIESSLGELEMISLLDLSELADDHGAYLCQALAFMWNDIPPYFESSFIAPKFIRKTLSFESVTFYGGSFNPWHEGHRVCVDSCPEKGIVIVPDFNPWKSKDQVGVSSLCRWRSFRELALSMLETDYSFYPGFWGINKPNPTSSWVSQVKVKNINMIIGDDSFMSIEKWFEVENLFKNLNTIYVTPRHHSKTELSKLKGKLESCYDIKFCILDEHEYQGVSSTDIRNNS